MINFGKIKFLKKFLILKKIIGILKSYFNAHEPISEMTKGDLLQIIADFKNNDTSKLNNDLKQIENEDQKRFRKKLKLIFYSIFILISIFGLIGPGREFYKDYKENMKTKEAIENLNKVASTMYFRENSPDVALEIIDKSLLIDEQNADTLYFKTFIESMLTVELIKNLDRPYNKEELLKAQTAMANAELLLESGDKEYYSKAYLIKAQTYFALGDNKRALIEIENAIKYNEDELFYKIRKASILVESGEYKEALSLLTELDKKYDHKDKKYIYLWEGLTYFELSKASSSLEEGIKYNNLIKQSFQKALEIDDKFHLAMKNLATTYAESSDGIEENNISDRKKAISLYKDVLKIRPEDKETYYLLGMAYGDIDKYEKSIVYFKKALEQDENYYSANLWLGKVYFELEDYEKALEYYNKAILLNPNSVSTYFRRAEIYQNLKKYKEAINDYLDVIEEFNNKEYTQRSYVNRALISIENDDISNAKEFLSKAAEIEFKKNSNYYIVQFKYYAKLNSFNDAIIAIDNAISESNKLKNSLKYEKALYQFKNNKFTDALDTINSIKSSSIEKLGLTEKILKLEYIIYNKINDKKNMERIIMQIREYDPNFKDENN